MPGRTGLVHDGCRARCEVLTVCGARSSRKVLEAIAVWLSLWDVRHRWQEEPDSGGDKYSFSAPWVSCRASSATLRGRGLFGLFPQRVWASPIITLQPECFVG